MDFAFTPKSGWQFVCVHVCAHARVCAFSVVDG